MEKDVFDDELDEETILQMERELERFTLGEEFYGLMEDSAADGGETEAKTGGSGAEKSGGEPQKGAGRRYSGKVVIHVKFDQYYYSLYASNGELLLQSEGYTTEKGALAGFATLKKNLMTGKIINLEDKGGKYYFKLLSAQNRIIVVSQTYKTRMNCDKAIESVKRFAQTAVLVRG